MFVVYKKHLWEPYQSARVRSLLVSLTFCCRARPFAVSLLRILTKDWRKERVLTCYALPVSSHSEEGVGGGGGGETSSIRLAPSDQLLETSRPNHLACAPTGSPSSQMSVSLQFSSTQVTPQTKYMNLWEKNGDILSLKNTKDYA